MRYRSRTLHVDGRGTKTTVWCFGFDRQHHLIFRIALGILQLYALVAALLLLRQSPATVRKQPRPLIPELILDDIDMLHRNDRLLFPLPLLLSLCFRRLLLFVPCRLPTFLAFVIRILYHKSHQSNTITPNAGRQRSTHVSVNRRAFLVHVVFVVVIYSEAREQDLVLVFAQRALEEELGVGPAHVALLDQGPEGRVVQVVDVA